MSVALAFSAIPRITLKESDLYKPVKSFLEGQGYEVKGEVLDCDVMAIRGSESPVIVELKLTLNLALVMQAVERLALADKVYICVPKKTPTLKKKSRLLLKTLRMLGVGLITVSSRKTVDVLLDPAPYKPRASKMRKDRLLREFQQRVGDPNLGGSDKRRGIMTAYRQKAIGIAQYLSSNGPSKASDIAARLSEPKSRDILYNNVYGWFERVERGIYSLSPRGESELKQWEHN